MKTILCYGDSNTHGSKPTGGRFGLHERWPGVLRDTLGAEYWVVEEGLGGRTTVWADAIEGEHKNGKAHLPVALESHSPIDLVVILLGTNDLKMRFSVPAQDVARGAGVLVEMVQRSTAGPEGKPPEGLLIAPPPFGPLTGMAEMLRGGDEKSRQLAGFYREVAQRTGCAFLNSGEIIVSSPDDGVHWDVDQHTLLGKKVAEKVKELLG
jgi:lysophospholipase L1-like esterase